ncbi:MAG: hypothetical protein WCE25_07700 [Nitrososphaeraceae archaeon]
MTISPVARNNLYNAFSLVTRSRKRQLICMAFACLVVMNILMVFSSPEVRPVMIDLTAVLTSGAAFFTSGTAILFAYLGKHKLGSYRWLFTGLMFWFSAEVIWAFTRQVLGIEIPYPSIADGAWIVGYGFFAIYIYRILEKMGKTNPIDKNMVVLISVAVALSLAYVLNLTYGVADLLSAAQDITATVVSFAYPVLDGLLLVPSMVILWSFRKGDPSSNQWKMMSVSFILLTIGDIGFCYCFALAPSVAEEFEWVWAIFYNTGYICIVAGVLWSISFTNNRQFINNKSDMEDRLKSK